MKNKQKYFNSINWLRGLSIIFVFVTHSISDRDNNPFCFSLFYNATLMFVVITGFLFWHLIGRFDYKSYLIKKLKFVILPYILLFGIPYILISAVFYIFNLETNSSNYFVVIDEKGIIFLLLFTKDLVYHLLVGGAWLNGPLWFIPMIVLFFLSSPMIKLIADSKYFNYILCFFIFVSVMSFRPQEYNVPIYSYIQFFGVFLYGIFLNKKQNFIVTHALIVSIVTGSTYLVFTFIDTWIAINYGRPNYIPILEGKFSILSVSMIQIQKLLAVTFFLSLFTLIEKNFQNIHFKFLSLLSTYSFGIFFIHYYWIRLCKSIFGHEISDLIVIFIAFPCTLLSLIIVRKFLTKLRINSRMIIGV